MGLQPSPDAVAAGHAFYTRRSLAIYDLAILGYFSRLAWRCPAGRVLQHYDEHVTGNHLDIGVGTGYFLDRCTYPTPTPRIVLMDPNIACLDAAQGRIARYEPERLQASVLETIEYGGSRFDSIAMTYLLHCLPGAMHHKAIAFEHIRPLAKPGSKVFGATLLSGGVERNWYARAVMGWNNKRGIFSSADDDLDSLRTVLEQQLDDATIEVVGCVALFAGRT